MMINRRAFFAIISGSVLSVGLVSLVAFNNKQNKFLTDDSYNNKLNSKNVLNKMYPEAENALHYLKREVEKSVRISQEDIINFNKEISESFNSLTESDFINWANQRMRHDFKNSKVFTVDDWIFSKFECLLWISLV